MFLLYLGGINSSYYRLLTCNDVDVSIRSTKLFFNFFEGRQPEHIRAHSKSMGRRFQSWFECYEKLASFADIQGYKVSYQTVFYQEYPWYKIHYGSNGSTVQKHHG